MKEFFAEYNIRHIITVPYHPKSNKDMEKIIGTIKNVMKKFRLGSQTSWKKALHIAVGVYWMFPHRTTGYFSFKMLYGRKAIWSEKLPHIVYNCNEKYYEAVENYLINMMEIHEVAMKRNWEYQQTMKTKFQKKVVKISGKNIKLVN